MTNAPIKTRRNGPRAGGYHVRTGCITCKIRRIKCDEEKPACLKCRTTGRECDGYLPIATACGSRATSGSTDSDKEIPSTCNGLPPSTAITGTDQERLGFEFFHLRIGQELSIGLGLDLARQRLLQASHTNPSVKSAVIAVGLMGRRLLVNSVLTLANEEANTCQELAQYQYCKALRSLREQLAHGGLIEEALVSCLLFMIFEFLRGNDVAAVLHLRSGLRLLCQDQSTNSSPGYLKDELSQKFELLDVQATFWLGLESFQSPVLPNLEDPCYSPSTLLYFEIFDEASESLNFQISRSYNFRRWAAKSGTLNSPDQLPPFILARHANLVAELEGWVPAVTSLLRKIARELSIEETYRLAMMRMNYHINLILLKSCVQDDEFELYKSSEHVFRQIVSLAILVLKPANPTPETSVQDIVKRHGAGFKARYPVSVFSFCAATIQPLYLTAIKCCDLNTCLDAIDLLLAQPWREGAWDSIAMARIAQRKVQQHREEGYYSRASTPSKQSAGWHDDQSASQVSKQRFETEDAIENWVVVHDNTNNIQNLRRRQNRSDSSTFAKILGEPDEAARKAGSRSSPWDITQVFQM